VDGDLFHYAHQHARSSQRLEDSRRGTAQTRRHPQPKALFGSAISRPRRRFRLGLADDHEWLGGGTTAGNANYCIPNMPTEEVFTTPHKDRADGTVTASKPLSHQGTMIEGIQVASSTAASWRPAPRVARRFSKSSLTPTKARAAWAKWRSFPTPLRSRKAASSSSTRSRRECRFAHRARPIYSSCLRNGDKLSPEELAAKGANTSLIHVDWMIGSPQLDIDGITATSATEPLMRKGEWA